MRWPQALTRVLLICLVLQAEVSSGLGFYHWNLAHGILFIGFWWLPIRWWWLLALCNTVQYAVVSPLLIDGMNWAPNRFLGYWTHWVQFFCGNVMPSVAAMAGAACMLRWNTPIDRPADTGSLARLHLAALAAAVVHMAKDLWYVIDEGQVGDLRHNRIVDMVPLGGPGDAQLLVPFALNHLIGAFVGVMLLAPLAMWWMTRNAVPDNRRILADGARSLLPAALVFLALSVLAHSTQVTELLRLLLLVAVILFALVHGWRGAALATLAVSTAVAVLDHLGDSATPVLLLQTFIAISGAMGLLFGAAVDDLQRQRAQLEAARTRADALTQRLSDAAAANLQAEERERKRIAGDLHDALGQSLTALQTHLQLASGRFEAAGQNLMLGELMMHARNMRHSIREVLERLRPSALDELGLYAALDRGSLRKMAEDAGLDYTVELLGDARLLPHLNDTVRITAYRMVQEAVTNVVRHATATCCNVRLRINRRGDALYLFLDIRDDGSGHIPRWGTGLTNMRDRITALGGRLHIQGLNPGLRLHAMLRQDGEA